MQTRATAARLIDCVVSQRNSLNKVLERSADQSMSNRDRAFLYELCFGVIRWYPILDRYLEPLLNKPLRAKDSDIKQLLLVGLYQICFLNTPAHASVSATVNACEDLNKHWAKNLVNAILRKFLRQKDSKETTEHDSIEYSHPRWIVKQLQHDWPGHWQDIIKANQMTAPLTIRVNQTIIQRSDYLAKLQAMNIEATACIHAQNGIRLKQSYDVTSLPAYLDGEFSVQDEAAQFAATLLDLKPGSRVLDSCAAPGGKTSHCLELQTKLTELVALDNNQKRLQRLEENLKRLKLIATICHGDVMEPEQWWDQQPFDRILLDAPCTASGIIRRHPDIKFLRQADDLKTVTATQQDILNSCWQLLKTKGKLLYATCSVFKAENDEQIETFLQHHADAEIETIDVNWGIASKYGRQILPGENNMDGFYYSCIIKQ